MKMIQFFNFTVALCFSILLLSFIQLFFYPLGIKNKESLVLCDIGFSIPEGIGENLQEGKTLFKANCQSCHARNMRSKSTGPALGGVEERWSDYPREDLYKWIRTSQKMIQEGHLKAIQVWEENERSIMNNFPSLTDEQIESILGYIDATHKGT